MAPNAQRENNGTSLSTKLWGVGVDKWVQIFQSVGVPTAILTFLLWTAYSYFPPVIEGHVNLLRRTGDTLSSMDETLKQSNVILQEVNEVGQETKHFMKQVCEDHAQQHEKMDILIEQTKPLRPGE